MLNEFCPLEFSSQYNVHTVLACHSVPMLFAVHLAYLFRLFWALFFFFFFCCPLFVVPISIRFIRFKDIVIFCLFFFYFLLSLFFFGIFYIPLLSFFKTVIYLLIFSLAFFFLCNLFDIHFLASSV